MSRTIKDMPWRVRACDYYGVRTPKDYRKDIWFDDEEWAELTGGRYNHIIYNEVGFSNSIVGVYAKLANRRYKAKCKQKMRHEDYDNMPVMRRSARWDTY